MAMVPLVAMQLVYILLQELQQLMETEPSLLKLDLHEQLQLMQLLQSLLKLELCEPLHPLVTAQNP
jgi:hypothetical protein